MVTTLYLHLLEKERDENSVRKLVVVINRTEKAAIDRHTTHKQIGNDEHNTTIVQQDDQPMITNGELAKRWRVVDYSL